MLWGADALLDRLSVTQVFVRQRPHQATGTADAVCQMREHRLRLPGAVGLKSSAFRG